MKVAIPSIADMSDQLNSIKATVMTVHDALVGDPSPDQLAVVVLEHIYQPLAQFSDKFERLAGTLRAPRPKPKLRRRRKHRVVKAKKK